MTERRFGPVQAAGVSVVELDAEKLLEAAPLGVTAYVGMLERGSPGSLISTYSARGSLKRIGNRISASLVPDAAQDFWQHSNGAGELHFIRITDGTERAASKMFYSRDPVRSPVLRVAGKSGGRWASRYGAVLGKLPTSGAVDLTATTVNTGKTFLLNELAGATFKMPTALPGRVYTVVSNTTTGVLTLSPDATIRTDYGAQTDLQWALELSRDTNLPYGTPPGNFREMAVQFGPGETDPVNEFSMRVFVNGSFVRRYPNLSMDPNSKNYCINLVNNDDGNDEVTLTDLLAPTPATPAKRPFNESGTVVALTPLILTGNPLALRVVNSPTGANPTVTKGTTTDNMKYRDVLTLTMTSATVFTVNSQLYGALAATGTVGTPYVPINPFIPPFTVVQGAPVLAIGDVLTLDWLPFEPGALVGGTVAPDAVAKQNLAFRIVANDHQTITTVSGDMTLVGSVSGIFAVYYPSQMGGGGTNAFGYDGTDGVTDAHFTAALDINNSKLNGLKGQNKGLIKLACPGRTASAVQKSGLQLAEANNWQFRVEIPDTVVTEDGALTQINTTVGRSDFGVTSFPSYADVDNPDKPGQYKRISLTGAIHGREALIAKNYDGYHKAAAGIDVTLPRVLSLPTIGTALAPSQPVNEELLNPQGVNVIKWVKGNAVIWGDRSVSIDPAWRFKHQRELMSHYENRMRESFDFIVFAINDTTARGLLITALKDMFIKEFNKGAVKGKNYLEAFSIKIDDEINTLATQANGDLNCEIKLRLADTVERFIIRVGKAGIFESLS